MSWNEGVVRPVALEALGQRYRRYRLADPPAEEAMAGSLRRWGQLPRTEHGRDPIVVRDLLPIAAIPDWTKQRRLWRDRFRAPTAIIREIAVKGDQSGWLRGWWWSRLCRGLAG